jgi:hypothetical protein
MEKKWLLREGGDESVVTTLATEMAVPAAIANLMVTKNPA